MPGNLAHELNNPASAAQRSAAGMLEELRVYGHERFNLGRLCLSAEKTEKVLAWEDQVRAEAKRLGKPAETEQTRREDEIVSWLQQHDIQESWHIAPELAEFGVVPGNWSRLPGTWTRAPSPWCSPSSLLLCVRRGSPRPCSIPRHAFSI